MHSPKSKYVLILNSPTEAGVAALLFLLVIIYFPSKPPKPPSVSAAVERLDFKEGLLILSKYVLKIIPSNIMCTQNSQRVKKSNV